MSEAYGVGYDKGNGDETCFTLFHDGAQQVIAYGRTAQLLAETFAVAEAAKRSTRIADGERAIEALTAERDALLAVARAAKALVAVVDAIEPEVVRVCQFAALHGQDWTGATFGEELDDARHALFDPAVQDALRSSADPPDAA